MRLSPLIAIAVGFAAPAGAETTGAAWLRYAPAPAPADLPAAIIAAADSPLVVNARSEILRGVRGMTGRTLRIESQLPSENAIVIGAAVTSVAIFQCSPGTSPRSLTPSISRQGDVIRIEGVPHASEPAALDYVEIAP